MCRTLQIQMIAECIKNLGELHALHDMGVVLLQGYLLANPGFEALPEGHFPAGQLAGKRHDLDYTSAHHHLSGKET